MITDKFEEQIFFVTVRVTIAKESGDGSSIGTGFLYQEAINDGTGRHIIFLISNKHVFINPKGTITVVLNKKNGEGQADLGNTHTFTSKDFSSIYFEHPDSNIDLACINASVISHDEHKVYYRTLTSEFFTNFDEDQFLPGKDVLFVGYPENRFDVHNNLPLLRKGYIASLPKVDFNNKKQFVIDAQVFQGSSGSPVFTIINNHFKLIGVVSETMIKHGQLQSIPTVQAVGVQQILGLGLVIKSTEVRKLINHAMDKIRPLIKSTDEPTVQ